MPSFRAGLLLAFWGGLSACSLSVGAPGSTIPGRCSDNAPAPAGQKTDILFVVDNSESMTDKQAAVARELPAFVQVLQQGAGVQQDFQVGLITTSVYQNALVAGTLYYQGYTLQSGRLQAAPVVLPDGGLAAGTERILKGSDPNLVDKFSRLVRVGVSGSGQETPFEATRLATTYWRDVSPDAGGNAGFFRDQAQLLIVTVMDEDDCSENADLSNAAWRPRVYVAPDKNRAPNFNDYCTQQSANLATVQSYYDVFQGLKDQSGAKRPVIWADIAPVSLSDKSAVAVNDVDAGTIRNVNCPVSYGAGYRHRAMAALFDSALDDLDSICDQSYHDALVRIAGRAVANQTIRVSGVPDPALLKVSITRASGAVSLCTVANGGISYEVAPSGDSLVHFAGTCERRVDDAKLLVQLLCAG